MMKRKFKKTIDDDIAKIDACLESGSGGKQLFHELRAKYTSYDSDFCGGLPSLPIEAVGGPTPPYKTQLKAVRAKLELILSNDEKTRFYQKEGFWSGVISGVLSSVIASGIIALIKYLVYMGN